MSQVWIEVSAGVLEARKYSVVSVELVPQALTAAHLLRVVMKVVDLEVRADATPRTVIDSLET